VVSKSTPWLILSIAARAAGGRMIVRSERPSSIVAYVLPSPNSKLSQPQYEPT